MDYGGTETLDLAQPFSAYTDIRTGIDPGRDNLISTADDKIIAMYSIPRNYPTFGQQNSLITARSGDEGSSLYTAYEATFNKQYSGGWSMMFGYMASYRKVGILDPTNPNILNFPQFAPAWEDRKSVV